MIRYQIEERIDGGSWQTSPGSVQDETYVTRAEAERVMQLIEREYAEDDNGTTVELRVIEVRDEAEDAMARADYEYDEARDWELTEGRR